MIWRFCDFLSQERLVRAGWKFVYEPSSTRSTIWDMLQIFPDGGLGVINNMKIENLFYVTKIKKLNVFFRKIAGKIRLPLKLEIDPVEKSNEIRTTCQCPNHQLLVSELSRLKLFFVNYILIIRIIIIIWKRLADLQTQTSSNYNALWVALWLGEKMILFCLWIFKYFWRKLFTWLVEFR